MPEEAETLALVMDDPDAPGGSWVHWVIWNIPANMTVIKEDSSPGIGGINDWGERGYGGPSPPSGEHRYVFKLYALDTALHLDESAGKKSPGSRYELPRNN